MTISLDARISQLNTASVEDFEYVYTFKTEKFKELEKHLHKHFADQRIRREFFTLNKNDLDDIVDLCRKFI